MGHNVPQVWLVADLITKNLIMDTTEIIHNALEWANKRLELQGEPITENQRNYIVFALRQQLTIPAVSNLLCGSFDPDNSTSSATKCKCGREKWEHPKAT